MRKVLGILVIACLLLSCDGRTARLMGSGDSVAFKYATLPQIVHYDGFTMVTISNPWKDGKPLHTYILVPREVELPVHLPKGTIIRTPLERTVVFTTVHSSLLMALGCQNQIAGVADLQYIKIPWIQKQVKAGKIVDCGDGLNPVVEKIIELHPDAILLSPFENSGGYGRLEDIDIPLVECAEYMETSPLARAEWMRFYGLLYGSEKRADSLFAVVDRGYNALKRQAEKAGPGRSILIDKQVGSVWYVPGGRSTIGQMIQDAGGQYPWSYDEHSGSLSLPFETVLDEASRTDVWLFRYDSPKPLTLDQLKKEKECYKEFRAYQTGEVYGCNTRTSRFYEESPFRPDWLLNDFISILHPDMPSASQPRYFQKISQ